MEEIIENEQCHNNFDNLYDFENSYDLSDLNENELNSINKSITDLTPIIMKFFENGFHDEITKFMKLSTIIPRKNGNKFRDNYKEKIKMEKLFNSLINKKNKNENKIDESDDDCVKFKKQYEFIFNNYNHDEFDNFKNIIKNKQINAPNANVNIGEDCAINEPIELLYVNTPIYFILYLIDSNLLNGFGIFINFSHKIFDFDYILNSISLHFPNLKIQYLKVNFKNKNYKNKYSGGYFIYNDRTYDKYESIIYSLTYGHGITHEQYNKILGMTFGYCENVDCYYKYYVHVIIEYKQNIFDHYLYSFASETQINISNYIKPLNIKLKELKEKYNITACINVFEKIKYEKISLSNIFIKN
jgi:hypothetical protein